jgi:hypothetical protein
MQFNNVASFRGKGSRVAAVQSAWTPLNIRSARTPVGCRQETTTKDLQVDEYEIDFSSISARSMPIA